MREKGKDLDPEQRRMLVPGSSVAAVGGDVYTASEMNAEFERLYPGDARVLARLAQLERAVASLEAVVAELTTAIGRMP